ncbi:sulfatase [Sphaerisporangium fuscum]|uniref:sulfatase n=1 Tax=Sphaerisporangium fuscum TaxID=2835868 RepID=UPI001BDC093F|nr:sulfatase [Sphaerisporangium fuscum]
MSFSTRSHRLPTQERTPAQDDHLSDDALNPLAHAVDAPGGAVAAERGRGRRIRAAVATTLAWLFVLSVLIVPSDVSRVTPAAFLRIPVEGLLCAAIVLVLPGTARRVAAGLIGVVLGVLAIWKLVDMGFYAVLDRPFNPVFDWSLLGNGEEFLQVSAGSVGAVGAVAAVALLAVAVLVLMTLSVLRLTRLLVRRNAAVTGAVPVLGVVWVVCSLLGTQIVPGVPVAALSYDRLLEVRVSLQDQKAFAAEAAVDAFRRTPGDELLTGLRGKDVMLVFVESYGRDAVEDPALAPQVDAALDSGTRRLRAAGFGSRSAFLSSPTAGGGSWLAHSTLLSGLWIDNQQRYTSLVKSNRLTLNTAFRRAGWRTLAVMPGLTQAWPEGAFYGYDKVYGAQDLGYRGPRFNWGTMPDQYTLSAFQRDERARRGHTPIMAEIPLVTSHAPWVPTPQLTDWKTIGDGSAYKVGGESPDAVWKHVDKVRAAYRGSIAYSLNSLISYVETYGEDDLVLVFLGDHQPAPLITGVGASRDVPITIVAHDHAVLDRISGWGWQDGLRPGPKAPVWRMDTFRDRFLSTFGSRPAATSVRAQAQAAH